jgi:solute carrier family 32 (vesicular inhibitory amino acid transporter)
MGICDTSTSAYLGTAIVGYLMFGNSAQPEVTLNLSAGDGISRIIIWIVIFNPVTKFALDFAPVALRTEGYLADKFEIPIDTNTFWLMACAVRTLLVALALAIVLLLPSFATVLGVLGSLCAFTISVAFPCWCYLRLFWREIAWTERAVNAVFALGGVCCALMGTYASACINCSPN